MATLEQLQTAYDELVSGQAAARFRDENGEEIQYSRADMARLLNRIRALERAGSTEPQGPLRVFF